MPVQGALCSELLSGRRLAGTWRIKSEALLLTATQTFWLLQPLLQLFDGAHASKAEDKAKDHLHSLITMAPDCKWVTASRTVCKDDSLAEQAWLETYLRLLLQVCSRCYGFPVHDFGTLIVAEELYPFDSSDSG